MLNLGRFPTGVHYRAVLQFPAKTHFSFSTQINFHGVLVKIQSGLCCKAVKSNRKEEELSLSEMAGPDEFEDDLFSDEEFDEDEDEADIPLKSMKERLETKPRGFGEGKVYDTSVEEKLMEEIEQSRKAQIANLNKLKNTSVKPSSKKGTTNLQEGFRVRLVNLPKKKNIHKDLKLAFKEVPGLLDIIPVVSGNEKTRDPICKGLAFVHFKSRDDAQRFVQNFSDKSISFGKVQKQIKYEMMDPKLPESQPIEESKLSYSFVVAPGELDNADSTRASQERGDESTNESSSLKKEKKLKQKENKGMPISNELKKESSSLEKEKKVVMKKKARAPKGKKYGNSKLPGSTKRLRVREKQVLTGVFTKYGGNAALINVEEEQSS